MEKPKRARKRKLDTAKANLKPSFAGFGRQGVHREVESERHEEKSRAVINGGQPSDELVGQRWDRYAGNRHVQFEWRTEASA